jgi:RES domain-containing protein
MRLWRLARKAFAKEPLSGEGGLYASGRWHSAPRLVVYASESLALASLEVLVHFDPDLSPRDLVALEIEVPANVPLARWTPAELPRSWRRYPPPRTLQKRGNAWLDGLTGAVLCVPSVLVPSEHNFLVNPLHPDARSFSVVSKTPFAFDPRLIGREREEG